MSTWAMLVVLLKNVKEFTCSTSDDSPGVWKIAQLSSSYHTPGWTNPIAFMNDSMDPHYFFFTSWVLYKSGKQMRFVNSTRKSFNWAQRRVLFRNLDWMPSTSLDSQTLRSTVRWDRRWRRPRIIHKKVILQVKTTTSWTNDRAPWGAIDSISPLGRIRVYTDWLRMKIECECTKEPVIRYKSRMMKLNIQGCTARITNSE